MNEAAQARYVEGLKLHRAKDYAAAVRALEEAVRLDPDLADAWEALGVLYDKSGRLDAAIGAMERLQALRPDAIMAWTNLSRFYRKKGWTEKAEEAQGKARLLGWKQELANGTSPGGDFQQAAAGEAPASVSLASLAESPAAPPAPPPADPALLARKVEQFRAILQVHPDDTLALLSLGKTCLQAGRAEEAVAALEKAVTLKPDWSAAYVPLAEAYEKSGRLARAFKTLERGIEVAERHGDLHPRNQMLEHRKRLGGTG